MTSATEHPRPTDRSREDREPVSSRFLRAVADPRTEPDPEDATPSTGALTRESVRALIDAADGAESPGIGDPSSFATTLQLLDRVERLQSLGESIMVAIERESGLRRSEFRVLHALHDGHTHPRHVGREIGMTTDAVVATAASLAHAGLVHVARDDQAMDLVLTDAGHSVLAQAEAVQIRAADAAVQHVGADMTARAMSVLDQIIGTMEPLAQAAGDGAAPQAPHALPPGAAAR